MAAMSARQVRNRARIYTVVGLFALFASFPFLWAIITMFKTDPDLYNVNNNPFLYNRPPTLAHLRLLFQETPYLTFVRNTVLIGLLGVLITLAFGIPAADASVPPAVAHRRLDAATAHHLVAGGHLPDLHDPAVGLAAERGLQLEPA